MVVEDCFVISDDAKWIFKRRFQDEVIQWRMYRDFLMRLFLLRMMNVSWEEIEEWRRMKVWESLKMRLYWGLFRNMKILENSDSRRWKMVQRERFSWLEVCYVFWVSCYHFLLFTDFLLSFELMLLVMESTGWQWFKDGSMKLETDFFVLWNFFRNGHGLNLFCNEWCTIQPS